MVYADSAREWNCSQWRNLTPSDAINRSEKHQAKLIHVSGFEDYLSPVIQELIAPADIIVFQRNLINENVMDGIQYWQGMGKPVAVDLDDAYHILPWSNPAHRFWIEREDERHVDMLERGLSICNALIAPNRLLLNDWQHVAKGYLLRNYSEKKWWENLKSRDEMKKQYGIEDKIVIGWGGSVSHYDSWMGSGIYDAAKSIANEFPNALFMVCGNDDRVFHYLPVPNRQKRLQHGVPPNQWPQIVKTFDIGIAPLFGPYDQRRSWIKGIEYLHAGVPWIGTVGEPYSDISHLGVLVENNAMRWEAALHNMIVDLKNQQKIAEERIELAKQFYADSQVETMIGAFQQVIRDFNDERGTLPGIVYISPTEESVEETIVEPVIESELIDEQPE